MNNISKRIGVLMVMFVFVGLFSIGVNATGDAQPISANDNVILSQDEYNDLIERVEELEQLKADEINNNLFDYYEKSKADRETSISEMFDGVSTAVTVLGILVTVLLAGTAFFNYREVKSATEKAEKTNKEANSVIDEVNKQLVISKEKVEEMDNNLKVYDEQVHNIEKKLLLLDETKNKLDLYIKRASAQTTGDLDLTIQMYTEVINEMEQLRMGDEYIFYERGNTYLSKFKLETEIVDNHKGNIEIEIKNLESIHMLPNLTHWQEAFYEKLLNDAIQDFEFFLEKSQTEALYIITKLKIIECLIYKQEYEKVFVLLNDVNGEETEKTELISKIIALIIIEPNLYETLEKNTEENTVMDISSNIYLYRELIFERIFNNEFVFNKRLIESIINDKSNREKFIQNACNELIKKINAAYKLYNKFSAGSVGVNLQRILGDFLVLDKIRAKSIEINYDDFYVFNIYCINFFIFIDEGEYKKIVDKIIKIGVRNYEISE